MQQGEFAEILDEQLSRISAVLGAKGNEYASQEDKLKNFRATALLMKISLPEAVASFMAKHTVSIFHMVQSGKEYPMEMWDEKITDHINYLILLKAALVESAKNPLKE